MLIFWIFCPVSNARNLIEVKWKAGHAKIEFLCEFHNYLLEKKVSITLKSLMVSFKDLTKNSFDLYAVLNTKNYSCWGYSRIVYTIRLLGSSIRKA